MNKLLKRSVYFLMILLTVSILTGLVLAWPPNTWRIQNKGITPEQAAVLRTDFKGPHEVFKTSDGETLFLRRWNPDTMIPLKKDVAVLIFHGFTAYSGPYSMAGIPISEGGYTTFGLDYRGHGLSGGNRGDSPGKDRWIGDLAEAMRHVRLLGFSKVIVLDHSLDVAAAICAADTVPKEIAGLVLLSGAYESRKGVTKPMSTYQKLKLDSSAIFRPSYRSVEYFREGMTVKEDTLFNFRYTPRFLTRLDVKKLCIPADMDVPVLVGVGDKDELFEVDKVKEFYDLVPGTKKEFLVMKNTTHAKIPRESWEEVVAWLDRTYLAH